MCVRLPSQDGLDIVGVHFDAIDAEAIVRRNDEAEVMKVMELVLASAVQCDDKTVYIEQIMGMGQEHQAELMVTIDSVMSRVSDSSSQRRGSSVSPTPRIPDGEMTATLQRDNQALKQAVSDLQTANLELTGELSAVQAENVSWWCVAAAQAAARVFGVEWGVCQCHWCARMCTSMCTRACASAIACASAPYDAMERGPCRNVSWSSLTP